MASVTSSTGTVTARDEITQTLRIRILRGIRSGSLRAGDRLPSARQYAAEFLVDFRVVLAAYRALAAEGLVEMRARGGIYVAAASGLGAGLALPAEWIVEVLAGGLGRDIPLTEIAERLRQCAATLRLRVVVIEGSADQVAGLCAELQRDYGLEAHGVTMAEQEDELAPAALATLRAADLLVTTVTREVRVRRLAARIGRPYLAVTVRPDLISGEWRQLLRHPAYVVVEDERFAEVVRSFFARTPGSENLRILVLGRDELSHIPAGTPTYVTQGARRALGTVTLPGLTLPAARLLSAHSARELVSFIVRENLRALEARRGG